MKKITIFLIALFFTTLSEASTPVGEISRIYPNDGRIYFKLKNDSCNPNGYYYFSMSSENGETWYSLILAAANTSKKIAVRVANCPVSGNAQIVYVYQDF